MSLAASIGDVGVLKIVSSYFFEQELEVEWTIPDVMKLTNETFSKVFSANFSRELRWQICIVPPKQNAGSGEEFFGIYLDPVGVNEITINCDFKVLSKNDHQSNLPVFSGHFDFRPIKQSTGLGPADFVKQSDLPDLLIDGSLKVQLVIEYLDLDSVTVLNGAAQRLKNFYDMIDNDEADYRIITSGGKDIGVHKFILSTTWPYFRIMVQTPMEEATENKWIVEDHNYETMKQIVVYMYTGYLDVESVGSALNLMRASNQYQIEDILDRCEEYLIRNVDVTLVFQVLTAAELYEMEELKKSCFAAIVKEKKASNKQLKSLTDFPGWTEFSAGHPTLLAELTNILFEVWRPEVQIVHCDCVRRESFWFKVREYWGLSWLG